MEFSTIPYHTILYHTIFVIFGTQPRYLSPGLHQSLDVLLSWADPESCCTIAFAMTFSTVAINAVLYIIVVSVIWLTNQMFWVLNIVFWIMNRVFSVLCFKADFFLHLFDVLYLFHVIHILQTYSMFSHPGWQDSTISGALIAITITITLRHHQQHQSLIPPQLAKHVQSRSSWLRPIFPELPRRCWSWKWFVWLYC